MVYDVAVIGGGASGLMAAGRAGEEGAKVIILEKNGSVGLKLLMTGGTRCNLTNNIPDSKILATNFGSAGRFLISAFSRFGPKETIEFFNNRGLATKIEDNNRVFPASDNAREVLKILVDYAQAAGVEIMTSAAVKNILIDKGKIAEVVLADGKKIKAINYIIATGGRSYPTTGSSGDAYEWLRRMGHNIITPSPALVPILLKDAFIPELEGLSREEIALSLWQDGRKIAATEGDILFTANGLSGPAALNLSRFISLPINQNLEISLDFFADTFIEDLDDELQGIFLGNNKSARNSLAGILPSRLMPVVGSLAHLDMEKPANSVTKDERRRLGALLKDFRLGIKGLDGYDRAMLTAGGLDLKEVDPKTMRSKIISNLFVAGEALDIAGPTGGFNLQACWSTGRIAGEAAVQAKMD
ncbi:MAG: NAD(P)/FAD-dependent oxidoreductase [Patescibacteria group bacterium]|jgi:hypothetical protein